MAKSIIKIQNFDLFENTLKSLNKIIKECKFIVNENGLTIYSQNNFARSEVKTNSITSDNIVEFCLNDISILLKLLRTLRNENSNKSDFLNIKFIYDQPFIKFESKKTKLRLATVKEDIIQNSISREVKAELTPVFEFNTSSNLIKNIESHSYIFQDIESARIYLTINDNMEKNILYANIGNKNNDFSNFITLKLGDIIFGSLDRDIVIDFDRLGLFNIIDMDNIKIKLMDKNVLVSEINILDKKTNTYLHIKLYNSLRKS